MARDATARLYDVDEDSIVFKKFQQSKKYDYGSVAFHARKGKLIDLDKLHESIWATRLSEGTRSGLVSLEITALGEAVIEEEQVIFNVAGSQQHFLLEKNPDQEHVAVFDELKAAALAGTKVVRVTGRIDGWTGRWPKLLAQLPPKPRRVLVTSFATVQAK